MRDFFNKPSNVFALLIAVYAVVRTADNMYANHCKTKLFIETYKEEHK